MYSSFNHFQFEELSIVIVCRKRKKICAKSLIMTFEKSQSRCCEPKRILGSYSETRLKEDYLNKLLKEIMCHRNEFAFE